MDMGSITAAIVGVKTATEIVKTMSGLGLDNAILEKVNELQLHLSNAYEGMLKSQEERMYIMKDNEQLMGEINKLKSLPNPLWRKRPKYSVWEAAHLLANMEPASSNFHVINTREFVYPCPIVMSNLAEIAESITAAGDAKSLDAVVVESDPSNNFFEYYNIRIGLLRTTVTRKNLLDWYQNRYGELPVFFCDASVTQ